MLVELDNKQKKSKQNNVSIESLIETIKLQAEHITELTKLCNSLEDELVKKDNEAGELSDKLHKSVSIIEGLVEELKK